jgi:hypothetical protein
VDLAHLLFEPHCKWIRTPAELRERRLRMVTFQRDEDEIALRCVLRPNSPGGDSSVQDPPGKPERDCCGKGEQEHDPNEEMPYCKEFPEGWKQRGYPIHKSLLATMIPKNSISSVSVAFRRSTGGEGLGKFRHHAPGR